MDTREEEYLTQINTERLYWKRLFYKATEGKHFADRMIQIDEEVQSKYRRAL